MKRRIFHCGEWQWGMLDLLARKRGKKRAELLREIIDSYIQNNS